MENFDYTRSFTRRQTLTLAKACDRHQMVANAAPEVGSPRREMMEQVWQAITGTVPAARTLVHDSIEISCPTQHATILHRSESMPAAFAFTAAAAALASVAPDDDLGIRRVMVAAWQAFENRRIAANEIREGFGCCDSASWHTMRDIEQAPDSDSLRRKIAEIARLAGQMFEAMKHLTTQVPSDDPHRVTGSEVGGKLERLMPAELGRLKGPTADMQAMRILQGKAQIRQMAGTKSQQRGPMVLLVDSSSSMHEENHAGRGRNTWAKACAIALTRVAWDEDRPVRVCHFSSGVLVHDIPKDDQRALFEMARTFLSGGTAFSRALRTAHLEVGDLAANGHRGADVVCITDGQEHGAGASRGASRAALDVTLDDMDTEGVKLWTVGIGKVHDVEFPLRKRAEKWVFAHDDALGDDKTTGAIVKGLSEAAKANDPNTN